MTKFAHACLLAKNKCVFYEIFFSHLFFHFILWVAIKPVSIMAYGVQANMCKYKYIKYNFALLFHYLSVDIFQFIMCQKSKSNKIWKKYVFMYVFYIFIIKKKTLIADKCSPQSHTTFIPQLNYFTF